MPRDITIEMSEFQELMDKRLNKTDLLATFKQMLDLIKAHQMSNKQDLGAVSVKYDGIVQDIKRNYSIKQRAMDFVNSEVTKMMSDHGARMGKVESKITSLELNTPLRMDTQIKAMAKDQILPLIPTEDNLVKRLSLRLPQLGEKVLDAVQNLEEDQRWEIKDVNELRKELEELRNLGSRTVGGGGGGVGSTQVHYYDISSQLNGVLKTFTMPAFLRILDIKLSSAPVLQPTTDWTSDSGLSTITFTSTIEASTLLISGQTLLILYAI